MKAKFITALGIFALMQSAYGQPHPPRGYAKTTVAMAQEDDYDVQYINLDLDATNLSTAISGHVRTVAKVVAPSMTDYYFELSDQLTIDSARVNGQTYSVTTSNTYVRKISLSTPLLQNAVFQADIYYHGAPTGGTGFFTNGILHQTDPIYGKQVTHTVSAAIHSRDWFPCKQSLTDKIDSVDSRITVPLGLEVAGNGVLTNVTLNGATSSFSWAMRYPVDYYLISFAVAPYRQYRYYMHFANSTDSMLIQNFVYDDVTIMPQHQDELDSIATVINYFSSLFGRYPFDKEKFGICMTPLGGGMENQTMVSLGSLDMELIAHELSHQWWGDYVTCQSLQDMWLNEGFATYCEQLFVEHFRSAAAMRSKRMGVHNSVIGAPGGSVYVDDTTHESRIYSGRLTYNKGAAVAHMLRYQINNDSLYFAGLQSYQQQYANKTATTEDFKQVMAQITATNLDSFFNQWVYKEGLPLYYAQWAQNGNTAVVKLTQNTSMPSSIGLFTTPVDILLQGKHGDTLIRVLNDHNLQWYSFPWSDTMVGMVIDPEDHILNKTMSITQNTAILSVNELGQAAVEIFPNPAQNAWQIRKLVPGTELTLYDMNGSRIWHGMSDSTSVSIPASLLPPAGYMLTISIGGNNHSYKLVKQ